MTPSEKDNAVRAQARKCTEEVKRAMSARPKPKWNDVVPSILKKHHAKVAPLGVGLVKFISTIGRMNGRYGVES